MRVYELARELGMNETKTLLKMLKDMGYDVRTASNSIPDEATIRVREDDAVWRQIEWKRLYETPDGDREDFDPPDSTLLRGSQFVQ